MDISKVIKNSLIVALFFTVLSAAAFKPGCRMLSSYLGKNNFLCVFEIIFLVVGGIAWATFSFGIFMLGFQQFKQREIINNIPSELTNLQDQNRNLQRHINQSTIDQRRQLRELKEQKDRQLQQQKNRITELEAELSMEREEVKKFQDKSVEYQKQRENKIKELETKIAQLTNSSEEQSDQITISLENISNIDDRGGGNQSESLLNKEQISMCRKAL